MERANPLVLIAGSLGIFLLFAGPGFFMDGVYLAKHEGDAVHFLDIVLRMAAGQVPHLDFMTPIGGLAFQPVVWFMGPGTGVGHAFTYAQMAVLAALMPAVLWVGISRLTTLQGLGFALIISVLVVAYVHGEAEPTLSLSMHYNRWSWAVAFIAVALAVLPPREISVPVIDGAIIGLALAILGLTKVTYAIALVIPLLVAVGQRREWSAIVSGFVAGLALFGVYTAIYGVNYWIGYIHDLAVVANSEVRSIPGRPLPDVLGGPAFLGATIAAYASVIALRQAGVKREGLSLFLLAPAFFYVTYQNFGNDPQWLYLLVILLLALTPTAEVRNGLGWDMRRVLTIMAVVCAALAAPSFFNLAYSPFRHLNTPHEDYTPLIPGGTLNSDIYTTSDRAYAAAYTWDMLTPESPFATYAERLEKPVPEDPEEAEAAAAAAAMRDTKVTILGEALPDCELADGLIAYFDAVAQGLEDAGYAGRRILMADLFSTINWVYGDFPPLRRGAPWSYGTAAGLENAEYLLVPLCPMHKPSRKLIVEDVLAQPEYTLTFETRTPLFNLYRVSGP